MFWLVCVRVHVCGDMTWISSQLAAAGLIKTQQATRGGIY